MDVSFLIPSRNEMFLAKTIENILANIRGDSEIIAVLDGAWADPPIPDHPRVRLLYLPQSIGQRAGTNLAARVARGRYVCKVDAHVAIDEGFDAKMMLPYETGEISPDTTSIPAMANLHAFNWRCQGCGTETYQGPEPTACATCGKKGTPGGPFEHVIYWDLKAGGIPGKLMRTDRWRFDHTLHFQYKGPRIAGQEKAEIADVMSSIGACFLMRRDRFWQIGGLDEEHGSWGQYGTEIACKSWLSGGRHVVNKRTYFAHMFRTRPGEKWGFPYANPSRAIEHARQHSQRLWYENAWPGQVRPLSWLIEHFRPIIGWHLPSAGQSEPDDPRARDRRLQQVMDAGRVFKEKRLCKSIDKVESPGLIQSTNHAAFPSACASAGSAGKSSRECGTRFAQDASGVSVMTAQRRARVNGCVNRARDPRVRVCERRQHESSNIGFGDGHQGVERGGNHIVGTRAEAGAGHASVTPTGRHTTAATGAGLSLRKGAPAQDMITRGIAYYSDMRGDARIFQAVRDQLQRAAPDLPIVSVTLKPLDFGRNIVLPLERAYLSMFKQILAGLEALDTDVACLCEHDVLYHPSHFQFIPPRADVFYYNRNRWQVRSTDGFAVHYQASQTSGCCAFRALLLEHYRKRVAHVEQHGYDRNLGFEAGTNARSRAIDPHGADHWLSPWPNVDIRHAHNLSKSKWSITDFRDKRNAIGWTEAETIPGWGRTLGRFDQFLADLGRQAQTEGVA